MNVLVVVYFIGKECVHRVRVWYYMVGRWKYACLKPKNLDELIMKQKQREAEKNDKKKKKKSEV